MKRFGVTIASILLVSACSTQQPSLAASAAASPSVTPRSPEAAPSQAASFEDVTPGDRLTSGRYVLHYGSIGGSDDFPTLAFTFSVPDGWSRVEIDGVVWGEAGTRLRFLVADNLYVDPCDPARGLRSPAVGPSVDDLVAALATVAGWKVTSSAAGTFHGYPGTRVELSGPEDLASCGEGESRLLHAIGNPDYSAASTDGERHDVRIIDVAGTRLVTVAITTGDATPEAETQLRAMVDSVRIQP